MCHSAWHRPISGTSPIFSQLQCEQSKSRRVHCSESAVMPATLHESCLSSRREPHPCGRRRCYLLRLHYSRERWRSLLANLHRSARQACASCLEGFIVFVLPCYRLAYTWQLYLIYHHVQRLPDRMTVKSSICWLIRLACMFAYLYPCSLAGEHEDKDEKK